MRARQRRLGLHTVLKFLLIFPTMTITTIFATSIDCTIAITITIAISITITVIYGDPSRGQR